MTDLKIKLNRIMAEDKPEIFIAKSEFKKLYDVACSDWKKKFDIYLAPFMWADEIPFTKKFVLEMKTECDNSQLKILKEIFGEFLKLDDNNAFIEEFSRSVTCELSYKLFGNDSALQIVDTAYSYIDRPDLKGRAFYVSDSYEVILHKTEKDGSIIEIKKIIE